MWYAEANEREILYVPVTAWSDRHHDIERLDEL